MKDRYRKMLETRKANEELRRQMSDTIKKFPETTSDTRKVCQELWEIHNQLGVLNNKIIKLLQEIS